MSGINTISLFVFLFSTTIQAGSIEFVAPSNIRKKEIEYRKKYIDLNGAYANANIFAVAYWSLNGIDKTLLFLQLDGQCRVVEFSTPENNTTDGILLDSPWCKFKSKPTIEKRGDESIIKYAVKIKNDTSPKEIRLNNKTGEICSNSFGNIDMQCP